MQYPFMQRVEVGDAFWKSFQYLCCKDDVKRHIYRIYSSELLIETEKVPAKLWFEAKMQNYPRCASLLNRGFSQVSWGILNVLYPLMEWGNGRICSVSISWVSNETLQEVNWCVKESRPRQTNRWHYFNFRSLTCLFLFVKWMSSKLFYIKRSI